MNKLELLVSSAFVALIFSAPQNTSGMEDASKPWEAPSSSSPLLRPSWVENDSPAAKPGQREETKKQEKAQRKKKKEAKHRQCKKLRKEVDHLRIQLEEATKRAEEEAAKRRIVEEKMAQAESRVTQKMEILSNGLGEVIKKVRGETQKRGEERQMTPLNILEEALKKKLAETKHRLRLEQSLKPPGLKGSGGHS